MSSKRASMILLALGIVFASSALVYPQSILLNQPSGTSLGTPPGTVYGSLSWANGSGPSGVPIIIENENGTKRPPVMTVANGRFNAKLPPGIYRIYVDQASGEGYHAFKRAKFRVLPGGDVLVNLSPYAGFDYCSGKSDRIVNLRSTGQGKVDVNNLPAPQYDVYENRRELDPRLDLVVEYCKKKDQKDSIKYTSVVITYDDMTIYADEAVIDKDDLQIRTKGKNVTYVDKGVTKTARRLTTRFGNGNLRIAFADEFPARVKTNGLVVGPNISFSINIERNGDVDFKYEDLKNKIKLASKPDTPFFLTAESPDRIRISGAGIVMDTSTSVPKKKDGYYNFTVIIQADSKRSSGSLSIEIPRLNGYSVPESRIPKGSVQIYSESPPDPAVIAEARRR
jgi:hypothetical protein